MQPHLRRRCRREGKTASHMVDLGWTEADLGVYYAGTGYTIQRVLRESYYPEGRLVMISESACHF